MNKAENFWDKASKNYDKTEERFNYIHEKSRENTKRFLKDSDTVLDYGCGTGTASCQFSSLVKDIYAIDISSEMIAISQAKAAHGKIENVNFEQADIFDGKYSKESYDVILAFNMLHTVPNPQNVVLQINELLKPEGLFISVTPCLRQKMSFFVNLQIQLVRVLCKLGLIPIPIRRVTSSEVESILKAGGFQTVESEEIYKDASSYFVVAKKLQKT
ncbi:MAG: class I SAM-dependent methyltransferase [Reinekea forsetii]|nr:class I SAM-dependent methyltransferase [Reinekea forsetii]